MEHNHPKILFLIGAVAPLNSTNANLMLRLIRPLSARAEVHVLSVGEYADDQTGLDLLTEHPVTLSKYSTRTHMLYTADGPRPIPAAKQLLYKTAARILDRGGYGDAFDGLLLSGVLTELDRKHRFSAVCACMEPYRCAFALYRASIGGKKILYLIDPPAETVPGLEGGRTPFRSAYSPGIISAADLLITTPRIERALTAAGYDLSGQRVVSEEFPLYAPLTDTPCIPRIPFGSERIELLYCGWLRNEAFLLEILKHLDDRFRITFVGNGSGGLPPVTTGAQLRTFPAVSRPEAVNAILDADVLLCIGNPYPVHIPSKVFEYVASGKPIIALHTLPDCPTLVYTGDYPLALNLHESTDPASAARMVTEFCLRARGQSVPPSALARLFRDIDSEHIIDTICHHILREASQSNE